MTRSQQTGTAWCASSGRAARVGPARVAQPALADARPKSKSRERGRGPYPENRAQTRAPPSPVSPPPPASSNAQAHHSLHTASLHIAQSQTHSSPPPSPSPTPPTCLPVPAWIHPSTGCGAGSTAAGGARLDLAARRRHPKTRPARAAVHSGRLSQPPGPPGRVPGYPAQRRLVEPGP